MEYRILTKMQFDSPTLKFQALTYNSYNSPLLLKEESIQLIKCNEGYDIPNDKILVKVDAAALNQIDPVLYNLTNPWIFSNKKQYGIGIEYSGTISCIGKNVTTEYSVGDQICGVFLHPFGKGAVAEYILIDPRSKADPFTRIPKNLSLTDASSWPVAFSTAYGMVQNIKLSHDSKILLVGGSTLVGLMCIQLCKNYYNTKEVVAVCSASGSDRVLKAGADSTIDYTKYESILAPSIEAAKDENFDYVFDCVGNSDLLSRIDEILKPRNQGSCYISISLDPKASTEVAAFAKIGMRLLYRSILSALKLSAYNYTFLQVEPTKEILDIGRKLIEDEVVYAPIDSVSDYKDFESSVDKLKSKKAKGKLILKITN